MPAATPAQRLRRYSLSRAIGRCSQARSVRSLAEAGELEVGIPNMLSKAVAAETVRGGGKSWYFISSDNAFGNSLTQDTTAFVEQAGGRVLGTRSVR
jgi:hypothetical protein